MEAYKRQVHYYETDQMQVVHHSNYIRYFEEARTEYFAQAGYPYDKLEEMGIVSPVLSVEAHYKSPLTYGDSFRVDLKLTDLRKVRCRFSYQIFNEKSGQLAVEGSSEHAFLNKDFKPLNIQRTFPDLYDDFLKLLESK